MFGPDLPERLADALERGLPGAAVQRAMEPELACGRHFLEPPPSARFAAVAIALYQRSAAWHLPLALRPQTMRDHAGQIGLPGGTVEPGEESAAAALRELHEELDIPPAAVKVLGSLSPIWVFASNFAVTPWLAVVQDCLPSPASEEVAELLEMPLSELVDPSALSVCRRRRGEIEFSAPCYRWQGHEIWGATALVLSELIALLQIAAPPA
jgi:8-oxo-dGTP pyrophosphatase MutT (NUDIX family)